AAVLLIGAIWPRSIDLGADLVDFHQRMRLASRLQSAREMLLDTLEATATNDAAIASKTRLYLGLAVFVVALIGCLPVSLVRDSASCPAPLHWSTMPRKGSQRSSSTARPSSRP